MRRNVRGYSVALLVILLAAALACSISLKPREFGKKEGGDSAWQYERVIEKALSARVEGQDVTLGELGAHSAQVRLPAGAFEGPVTVELVTPQEVPNVQGGEFTPMGAPISLSAGDEPVRLDEAVQVTLRLDPGTYSADDDPGTYRVAYYNGQDWDYLLPDEVDLNSGTLHFSSYHFSLFGWGKISAEERLKQYTHNAALAEYTQSQLDEKLDEAAANVVKHMLKENLGIDSESVQSQVITSLLTDDQWGDLVSEIKKGNVGQASQEISVLAGKAIVMVVPDSTMKSALDKLKGSGGVGLAAAAARAVGALAEGDRMGAARILGEQIADQFVVTTAAKIAVATVQYSIDCWRNSEVEAAYQAYKNGSNAKFYGYNVDAGNFDALWSQMRGIARQLEIEAVKAQNKALDEAGHPRMNAKEEAKLKQHVNQDLQKQFERRMQEEARVAEHEEEIKRLIALYDENKLLLPGVLGYRSALEMEQRLDSLLHLKNRIMLDLGADTLVEGVLLHDGQLGMDAVVRATLIYMDKGKEAYRAHIQKTFGVALEDDEAELDEEGDDEEEEFDITKIQPVKFTVSGEFVSADGYYENWKCAQGKGRFTLEIWNVGALGGEEYAIVDFDVHSARFVQKDNESCKTMDYDADWSEYVKTGDVTFSGGPNGSIFLDNELPFLKGEFARIVDGKEFHLLRSMIVEAAVYPLSDPSLFDGFK